METITKFYDWMAGLPVFLQIPIGLAIAAAAPFVLYPVWLFFRAVYIGGLIDLFRAVSGFASRLLPGSGKAGGQRQVR